MIDYTLIKSKGIYTLEVAQETTYKLLYISTNLAKTVLTTTTILINTPTSFKILEDGLYKLVLAENTIEETFEEFYIFKNLQKEVVENIQKILCKECIEEASYCNTYQGLSPKEEALLTTQSIFNNILAYQNYCLPFYSAEYLSYFANYLSAATSITKEKIQKELNKSLAIKIVTGTDVHNENLFRTSLFIYWVGFYLTEKYFLQDAENIEEIEYLESKFKLSEISTCAEDLTFSFTQLETVFNNNIKMTQIYQHQLDFVGQGIEDLVDQEFYTNSYNQSQMLVGIAVTFSNIAKFGFIVKDASKNPYKIVDPFGNDITDSFDYYYLDNISYYLSKENVSYSTISFKFQKNN